MTMTAERPQTVSERIPNTGVFTVSYREFLAVLRAVGVAVGRARNLPVLSRVLVTVGAGEVEVTAFDFDLAVTIPLPARLAAARALAHPRGFWADAARPRRDRGALLRPR